MDDMMIMQPEAFALLKRTAGEPSLAETRRALRFCQAEMRRLDAEAAEYARACRWLLGMALAGWFLVAVLVVLLVTR